nr:MAG TPA: hypothetical protein [Bacteriophage sp.]
MYGNIVISNKKDKRKLFIPKCNICKNIIYLDGMINSHHKKRIKCGKKTF